MIGRVARLRVGLGLTRDRPLVFLAEANAIYQGLEEHPSLFPDPFPALPALLGHIGDATRAQQDVDWLEGAGAVRDAAFAVLRTSLECERMMVQTLCDASPEQAAQLISAASMTPLGTPGFAQKPLLALKNALPSGTVLLDASAKLLDGTRRKKTFNWRGTADGGLSFFAMPSTPTGKTRIAGLTRLTTVGFQVSVTLHGRPAGPWSPTESILVL
jgi:hypothetical protein